MNKIFTERHRICIEPETSPVSQFSAGSTAYSLVKKIGYLLDKLFDAIKDFISEKFNDVKVDVDTSSLATQEAVAKAKDEVLDAISKINTYEVLDKDDWDEITGEEPEPEPEQNVVAFMCMAAPHYEDQYKCTYGGEIQYEGRTWYLWTVDPTYHTPEVHFTLMRNPKAGDPCYEGNPIEDPNNEREIFEVYYE